MSVINYTVLFMKTRGVMYMYWNMVNRDGQKFVENFGQAPSKIYMTTDF